MHVHMHMCRYDLKRYLGLALYVYIYICIYIYTHLSTLYVSTYLPIYKWSIYKRFYLCHLQTLFPMHLYLYTCMYPPVSIFIYIYNDIYIIIYVLFYPSLHVSTWSTWMHLRVFICRKCSTWITCWVQPLLCSMACQQIVPPVSSLL